MLRKELQRLYAQRVAVEAAIRELESQQASVGPNTTPDTTKYDLEFSSKPCNLTSCRSA
jgi:hypothetical protein